MLQTTDQPTVPRVRETKHLQSYDSKNTTEVKQPALSSPTVCD